MTEKLFLVRIGYELEIVGAVPPAVIGEAYSVTFTARGGPSPYTFSLVSENLTDNHTFVDNGDGTCTLAIADPQTVGDYTVVVRLKDSTRYAVRRTITIEIPSLAPSLSGSFDDAVVGAPVSHQYTLIGSATPLTASVVSGSLPAGLSMDSSGLITGTPTTGGTSNWTVRVVDSTGNSADVEDSIYVLTPYYVATSVIGGIFTSSDATTWASRTNPLTAGSDLYTVFYGNGILVAANDDGELCTSDDNGETWTARTIDFDGERITCGAYGGGVYVVAGYGGRVAYSSDAITWTRVTPDLTLSVTSPKSCAFMDGRFVIGSNVNSTDGFHASTDGGVTWELSVGSDGAGVAPQISLTVAGGEWLASSNSNYGNTYNSADGSSWSIYSDASEELTVSLGFNCPHVYFNDTYVGVSNSAAPTKILTSADASVWSEVTNPSGTNRQSWAIADRNQVIVLGFNGTVLKSSDLSTWNQTDSVFSAEHDIICAVYYEA